MNNFKLLNVVLCALLGICTYNANGMEIVKSQDISINKTNLNNNIELCIPDNTNKYYSVNQSTIDMYPVLQYFTNNKAVDKQYTLDELYTIHETLDTSVRKYVYNSNETSMKIVNSFKTINDFIAKALLEERRNKVIPIWNTINDMIIQNKV